MEHGGIYKKAADAKGVPAEIINGGAALDHGAMVPLYFLAKNNRNLKIVLLAFSYLDYEKHFEFGEAICEAIARMDKKIPAEPMSGRDFFVW